MRKIKHQSTGIPFYRFAVSDVTVFRFLYRYIYTIWNTVILFENPKKNPCTTKSSEGGGASLLYKIGVRTPFLQETFIENIPGPIGFHEF